MDSIECKQSNRRTNERFSLTVVSAMDKNERMIFKEIEIYPFTVRFCRASSWYTSNKGGNYISWRNESRKSFAATTLEAVVWNGTKQNNSRKIIYLMRWFGRFSSYPPFTYARSIASMELIDWRQGN